MSVQATYSAGLTVNETIATGVPDATSPIITHSGFATSYNLNAGSTPPASLFAAFLPALTAGALTIDLTALVGTNGATVNGNGLKVRAFRFTNPQTNAAVTVKVGASNGYLLLGASWSIILQPGDDFLYYGTATPTIGSSAKNIDLAGTGTQAFQCAILIG